MSEEEKKAIENVNNFIDIVTVILPKYSTKIPEYCIDENSWLAIKKLLNLIKKQQEQLQEKDKVIDLLASELVEFTGSCPVDAYDYEGIDCENKCDIGIEKQCFIEYFTKEARKV